MSKQISVFAYVMSKRLIGEKTTFLLNVPDDFEVSKLNEETIRKAIAEVDGFSVDDSDAYDTQQDELISYEGFEGIELLEDEEW